jgi:1,4-dihydroxy-2-naphthoate octaprenyltransferase
MMSERSAAVLKSLSGTHVYPAAMVFVLLGTSAALTMGQHWLGLTGLLLLAVMSLTYGAVQTADDIP